MNCRVCGEECRSQKGYHHACRGAFIANPDAYPRQAQSSNWVCLDNHDFRSGPGLVSTGRPWNDERNTQKLKYDERRIPRNPLRTCVFDIEATALDASFGRVLCCAIQSYDPPEMKVFRADDYESWRRGLRADDSEIVRDILNYLQSFDIWYAHNGVNYDVPFLRTKAVIHGLPPVEARKVIDPVLLARKRFRFHSNSLDSIASVIGTEFKKSVVAPEAWRRAVGDGDKDSMDYIVDHCVKDVAVLEEVAHKLQGYVQAIDQYGSWR